MSISASSGTWTVGDNWPWPRMYLLTRYTLAVAVDTTNLSLYEMTLVGGVITATKVQVLGTLATIDSVHIADFGPYYVVTVSKSTPPNVIYTRSPTAESELEALEEPLWRLMPPSKTCCNYKNQLILGGIVSDDYKWSSLGSASVAWSAIGHTEFDPQNDPTAGFMPMPWSGIDGATIQKVMKLGKVVRVYGNFGVSDLVPTNNQHGVSFGKHDVVGYGSIAADTVDGDQFVQVFLNADYDLCLSTSEGVKVLGFRRHMENLTGADTIIVYDRKARRFYISDGVLSYVYNEHGMYSTNQCVTSIGRINGQLGGFIKDNSDSDIRVKTTETDFGVSGMKTVEAVESGVDYDVSTSYAMKLALSGNYTYRGDYITLGYDKFNIRGIATKKMTARDFKFLLKSTFIAGSAFNLNSLKIKIKYSDKRNIRGRLRVT